MVDYRAVPKALRANVKFLQAASDAWESAAKTLKDKQLGEDDLGMLGKAEGVPKKHNDALQSCLDKLNEGRESLEKAATALGQVAMEYESRDAKYYRKFGYIDEQLKQRR